MAATPAAYAAAPTVSVSAPLGNPAQPLSFDVDLHEARPGETYETISKEAYNDARYARALAEYNRNKRPVGTVEVPPIHELKKKYPAFISAAGVAPDSGGLRPAAGGPTPTWGPAAATSVSRPTAPLTFKVPPGGMTLQTVADKTLGSAQRWQEVSRLNPRITDVSALLPAGTELMLPADAKLP